MVTRSVLRYARITPRKFRLIIPLVKGKNPETAIAILYGVKKKASMYGIDLLKSAIANAKHMQGVDVSNLYISKMVACTGPMLKRFRAASMGRASMIHKHTSHLTVELDELKPSALKEAKAKGAHAHEKHEHKASEHGHVHGHKAEKPVVKKHKAKEHAKPQDTKKGKE